MSHRRATYGRHRKTNNGYYKPALIATVVAIGVGLFVSTPSIADTSLSQLELAQTTQHNCQLLSDNSIGEQQTRAQTCVSDQQKIIDLLTPTGSPSPSPTITDTPEPTPTATPTESTTPSQSPSTTPTSSPSPTITSTPSATSTSSPTPSSSTSTTTTSPSPTSSPTPSVNCLASPHVCGYPDSSNTGPRAGQAITTTINGDFHVKTLGAVISNTRINGCVFIEATGVTIMDSIISSHCAIGIRTFNGNTDFAGLVVQDTEIDGNNDPNSFTAFEFSEGTFYRDNIHGWENGFFVGANNRVKDTYIHDLKCPQPNAANSTCDTAGKLHPDSVQVTDDASNNVFDHNTVLAPITNSAFAICCTSGGTVHDFSVTNSLLSGGGFTVYCPRYTSTNIIVTNNRFGTAHFGPLSSCVADHVTYANNVFDNNNQPVPQA